MSSGAQHERAYNVRHGRVKAARVPLPILKALLTDQPDAVDRLVKHLGYPVVQAIRTLPERGDR